MVAFAFWLGCEKGVDVGMVGAWDIRLTDTVLSIPSLLMVTV